MKHDYILIKQDCFILYTSRTSHLITFQNAFFRNNQVTTRVFTIFSYAMNDTVKVKNDLSGVV